MLGDEKIAHPVIRAVVGEKGTQQRLFGFYVGGGKALGYTQKGGLIIHLGVIRALGTKRPGDGCGYRGERLIGRMFFFEKENQKTFATGTRVLARSDQAANANRRKLFASFSRKRRPSFLT
jgi:hypothetical protein